MPTPAPNKRGPKHRLGLHSERLGLTVEQVVAPTPHNPRRTPTHHGPRLSSEADGSQVPAQVEQRRRIPVSRLNDGDGLRPASPKLSASARLPYATRPRTSHPPGIQHVRPTAPPLTTPIAVRAAARRHPESLPSGAPARLHRGVGPRFARSRTRRCPLGQRDGVGFGVDAPSAGYQHHFEVAWPGLLHLPRHRRVHGA